MPTPFAFNTDLFREALRATQDRRFTLLYNTGTQDEAGQEQELYIPVPGTIDIPCIMHTKENPGNFDPEIDWVGLKVVILTFEEFIIPDRDADLRILFEQKTYHVREASIQDSYRLGRMFMCEELRRGD